MNRIYLCLICIEHSTQWVQGDGLVELMLEHVLHVKNANIETIMSDCEHQEEESCVYCKIGQILTVFVAHIDKWAAQTEVIL